MLLTSAPFSLLKYEKNGCAKGGCKNEGSSSTVVSSNVTNIDDGGNTSSSSSSAVVSTLVTNVDDGGNASSSSAVVSSLAANVDDGGDASSSSSSSTAVSSLVVNVDDGGDNSDGSQGSKRDGVFVGNVTEQDDSGDNGIESPTPKKRGRKAVSLSIQHSIYRCHFCQKTFVTAACLQKHTNYSHPHTVSIHECVACNYVSPYMSNANRHLTRHDMPARAAYRYLLFNTHFWDNADRVKDPYNILARAMVKSNEDSLPDALKQQIEQLLNDKKIVVQWGMHPRWGAELEGGIKYSSRTYPSTATLTTSQANMLFSMHRPSTSQDDEEEVDDDDDNNDDGKTETKSTSSTETATETETEMSTPSSPRFHLERYPRKRFWDCLDSLVTGYCMYKAKFSGKEFNQILIRTIPRAAPKKKKKKPQDAPKKRGRPRKPAVKGSFVSVDFK